MERFMEFEKNIEKNFNYDKIFTKIDNIRFQQEYDNKFHFLFDTMLENRKNKSRI